MDWLAPTAEFAQSVDQRIKMAGWLELFEDRGGTVVFHGVTTSDLHALARLYDLVVIAAGKGELVQLFDRDPRYSPFTSHNVPCRWPMCTASDPDRSIPRPRPSDSTRCPGSASCS